MRKGSATRREKPSVETCKQAAGMVVHPSPGHYTGTLVNALLNHCKLPAMQIVIGNELPPQSLSPAGRTCLSIAFQSFICIHSMFSRTEQY